MARAHAYGLGWVAVADLAGLAGLAGAIATEIAELMLWPLSGIGVGAAQWALVRARMRISPMGWTAATAVASLGAVAFFLLLAQHVVIESSGDLNPSAACAPAFIVQSIIAAVVCGLILGILQVAALRDTPLVPGAWVCATIIGVMGAWLYYLGIVLLPAGPWYLPQAVHQYRWTAIFGGYWVMLCLPQAVLIARAIKSAAPATEVDTRQAE